MYIGLPTLNASRGRTQLFWQVARRAARILAALVGLACGYLLIMSRISGPLLLDSTVQRLLIQNCESNWWRNLTFLLNWQPLSEMVFAWSIISFQKNIWTTYLFLFQCLPHTWYLSTQMQLLVVALILLLIFGHRQRLTINFLLLIFSACGFISCLTNLHFDIPPTLTGQHFVNQRFEFFFKCFSKNNFWLISFSLCCPEMWNSFCTWVTYPPINTHPLSSSVSSRQIFSWIVLRWSKMPTKAPSASFGFFWFPSLYSSLRCHSFGKTFTDQVQRNLHCMLPYIGLCSFCLSPTFHLPAFPEVQVPQNWFPNESSHATSVLMRHFCFVFQGCFGQFLCSPRFVPLSRLSLCIYVVHPLVIIAQHFTRTSSITFSNAQFVSPVKVFSSI